MDERSTTVDLRAERPGGLREALDEIARPALQLGLLSIVFVAVLSAVGLVLVHGPVGTLRSADDRAMDDVVAARTPALDTATDYATWLAETLPVLVLTFLAMYVAWRASRRLILPGFIALAVFGEKLIYLVTSLVVQRERPDVETLGSTYATASFPSGHVGSAVALYGSIALVAGALAGRRWRNALLVLAAVFALVVAFARTYRGFHFPGDVLAGAVLGVGWLWLCWELLVVRNPAAQGRSAAPTTRTHRPG